jgi:integrase
MLNTVEAYLRLRRAAGFDMTMAEYLLKSFAGFATDRGDTHVHAQSAIDWAALGPSVAQRDARLKAVCRFVRFIRVEDGRHEVPPANHFGARKKRRPPHIYSADEINRLIEAALRIRPASGLRPQTYATLIALLAVTGQAHGGTRDLHGSRQHLRDLLVSRGHCRSHARRRRRWGGVHVWGCATMTPIAPHIEAYLRIRPASGLRPQTYATLIALLAVTGLRISEALKLQVADMTNDGLLIRETSSGRPV